MSLPHDRSKRPAAPGLPAQPPALAPGTRPIAEALQANDMLASLTRRVRESGNRLAALQPLLPAPMRAHVLAGPIDETGFTLLAANQAVLVKLRQMLPTLDAHLLAQGFAGGPLRVKLLSRD